MKEFLEKNKTILDWSYRILTILLKVGIPSILLYFLNGLTKVKGFISDNQWFFILLILIICLFVLFELINLKRKVNSIILEEINIVSDEETMFEYSDKFRNIATNTNAVVAFGSNIWSFSNNHYNELKNSKWIAHDKYVTVEEAHLGGDYHFKRIFNNPVDIKKIKSADLFFVVDDYCTLIVNNSKICSKVEGNLKLHKYDILKYLKKGDNDLRFVIDNVSFDELLRNQPNHSFWKSKEQHLDNPYGIRFCMTIKYIK
jgi:hypothetical protein